MLAALAPSAWVLIAARFLTGIGAAMIFGTSFALLSLSLPANERGKALGTNIIAGLSELPKLLGFMLFLSGLAAFAVFTIYSGSSSSYPC